MLYVFTFFFLFCFFAFLFFQSFFYSRKNFMKPSHQEYPHRNFQEEVEFLNEIFPSE